MEIKLLEILETATIAISGFLIKKYVLLEPDMEAKKQQILYVVSFLLTGIVFFALGKDAATAAILLMIGFNICLGRKEHRLRGLFSMIPFLGIINGLIFPVLFVPPYRFALTAQATSAYQLVCYALLAILFLLFYVKGKDWRRWMRENMQNRSLPLLS